MLNNFSIFTLCVAIGSLALTGCQKPDTKADVKTDTPVAASAAMDHSKMTHDNMACMDHSKMNHQDVGTASTPALASTESVYLTNGKWTDQTSKLFDLNALKGRKQVTAFIYTSCQQVCPIMMKTMKDMQDKLPADIKAKTGFLVVSLDPKRDTPQVLAKFGEHYKTDGNWVFLSGSDDDIRMLANTMNIRYQFAEGGMINHSNVISVLDENGNMIEQAIGNSKGEAAILAALQKPAAQ